MLEAKMVNLAITDRGFAIILKSENELRLLPIFIATIEAQSIIVAFLKFEQSRPLSHDLIQKIIDIYAINLKYIVICGEKNGLFLSKMVLGKDDEVVYIDSRPSDAIAVALRVNAKIYIEEEVLDRCGLDIDSIGGISKNGEIPFRYKNLDEDDIADTNIIKDPNVIFEKYSDIVDKPSFSLEASDYHQYYNEPDVDYDIADVWTKKPQIVPSHNTYNLQDDNESRANGKKEKLLKLLENAIKEERYEDAASYRDELNKYKD